MNKPRSMILFIVLVVLLSSSVVWYVTITKAKQTKKGTLRVVVSFYPLYYLAQSIGGMYVDVTTITPPGVEPHDFEPTAQDIARIQGADVVILNGGGLESYARSVSELVKGSRTKLIIVLQDNAHDPHSWLDPVLFAETAGRIANAYYIQDSGHTPYFASKLEAVRIELKKLDAQFMQSFVHCERRTFVTSHNAFSYVARRYDLTQMHIAGISPEDEPNPRSMATVAEFVKKNKIQTVFFEELVSPKLSETIAQETGANTDVLSPIEGLTAQQREAGKTYLDIQRENMVKLSRALGCKPQ